MAEKSKLQQNDNENNYGLSEYRLISNYSLPEDERLIDFPSNRYIVKFYHGQINDGIAVSKYVEGMLIRGITSGMISICLITMWVIQCMMAFNFFVFFKVQH